MKSDKIMDERVDFAVKLFIHFSKKMQILTEFHCLYQYYCET